MSNFFKVFKKQKNSPFGYLFSLSITVVEPRFIFKWKSSTFLLDLSSLNTASLTTPVPFPWIIIIFFLLRKTESSINSFVLIVADTLSSPWRSIEGYIASKLISYSSYFLDEHLDIHF